MSLQSIVKQIFDFFLQIGQADAVVAGHVGMEYSQKRASHVNAVMLCEYEAIDAYLKGVVVECRVGYKMERIAACASVGIVDYVAVGVDYFGRAFPVVDREAPVILKREKIERTGYFVALAEDAPFGAVRSQRALGRKAQKAGESLSFCFFFVK